MTIAELITKLSNYDQSLYVMSLDGGDLDLVIANPDGTITVIADGGLK